MEHIVFSATELRFLYGTLKNYPELPAHGDFVVVLLTPQLLRALDRYVEEETDGVTRAIALRSAFEDWCVAMGYILPNEMDRRLN